MEQLQTATLTDLPAIIQFIMQHVTTKNAQEVSLSMSTLSATHYYTAHWRVPV